MSTLIVAAFCAVTVIVYVLQASFERERSGWTEERRELLNRIQHPEIVPTLAREPLTLPEPEPDDYHMVGTVVEPEDVT